MKVSKIAPLEGSANGEPILQMGARKGWGLRPNKKKVQSDNREALQRARFGR